MCPPLLAGVALDRKNGVVQLFNYVKIGSFSVTTEGAASVTQARNPITNRATCSLSDVQQRVDRGSMQMVLMPYHLFS